jgi:hypothetical protein
MAVEKLTKDISNDVTEEFFYDHADGRVVVQHKQDDTAIRDHVARQRLHGTRCVEGLGYLIGEIPVTVVMEYAKQRGIPWEKLAYRPEYADEMRKLCMMNPALNPSGKSVW